MHQEAIVNATLSGKDVFVLMPTGEAAAAVVVMACVCWLDWSHGVHAHGISSLLLPHCFHRWRQVAVLPAAGAVAAGAAGRDGGGVAPGLTHTGQRARTGFAGTNSCVHAGVSMQRFLYWSRLYCADAVMWLCRVMLHILPVCRSNRRTRSSTSPRAASPRRPSVPSRTGSTSAPSWTGERGLRHTTACATHCLCHTASAHTATDLGTQPQQGRAA